MAIARRTGQNRDRDHHRDGHQHRRIHHRESAQHVAEPDEFRLREGQATKTRLGIERRHERPSGYGDISQRDHTERQGRAQYCPTPEDARNPRAEARMQGDRNEESQEAELRSGQGRHEGDAQIRQEPRPLPRYQKRGGNRGGQWQFHPARAPTDEVRMERHQHGPAHHRPLHPPGTAKSRQHENRGQNVQADSDELDRRHHVARLRPYQVKDREQHRPERRRGAGRRDTGVVRQHAVLRQRAPVDGIDPRVIQWKASARQVPGHRPYQRQQAHEGGTHHTENGAAERHGALWIRYNRQRPCSVTGWTPKNLTNRSWVASSALTRA